MDWDTLERKWKLDKILLEGIISLWGEDLHRNGLKGLVYLRRKELVDRLINVNEAEVRIIQGKLRALDSLMLDIKTIVKEYEDERRRTEYR